ncbi:MAG: hypothetical protein QW711_08245 [Candidatus Korarchaeum sp.]
MGLLNPYLYRPLQLTGAVITNTLTEVVFLLFMIGVTLLVIIALSYVIESLENFTLRNPAMSLLVFVLAVMVAFNSDSIVRKVMELGFQGGTGGGTIFGFLFGREISRDVVKPLLEFIMYWILILTSLLIAIPNAIYSVNELITFQIGRINAAGAFVALMIAIVMLLGLPYFHGRISELVSKMPDFMTALNTLLGG